MKDMTKNYFYRVLASKIRLKVSVVENYKNHYYPNIFLITTFMHLESRAPRECTWYKHH